MLIRHHGHQWPRWNMTAIGPRSINSSRLTRHLFSPGRTNGGIASPITGAAEPATVFQATDENLHCIGIERNDLADGKRIAVEPLFEGGIHVTTALEGVAEGGERGGVHESYLLLTCSGLFRL